MIINLSIGKIDHEVLSEGIREQDHDTRQILFSSLIKNIPHETIMEV